MSDFTTGKSVFVLAIVAGCFAILWPNVFYPMLQGPPLESVERGKRSGGGGCCDVMFDKDVNAIKLVSELCEHILAAEPNFEQNYAVFLQQGKLTKDIVNTCQKTVFKQCAIDIVALLNEKVSLGRSYKQLVDDLRSLNSSLCLKHAFGISFNMLGLPRPMRVWGINQPKHMHQERPPHLRPEFLHPALREKGSAIPQSHVVPKIVKEGRPGPIPGLRPPMGGAGHVVSPPKGGSTMGIVMPMYTIGIVVFFLYTMMKLLFKKSEVTTSYEMSPDPEFRHSVFGEGCNNTFVNGKEAFDDSKLVVTAITGLVEEVNRQIRSEHLRLDNELLFFKKLRFQQSSSQNIVPSKSEVQTEADEFRNKTDDVVDEKIATKLPDEFEAEIWNNSGEEDEAGKGTVKVVGMELTERCEKQGKWSRPPTPQSRPTTPQNFYITGPLSQKSKFLVSDSHTETDPADDNAIVLTGKVTLSLIGLDNVSTLREIDFCFCGS
ncbi:unnamed protein product [Nesidiocoris tenuis]|uniref:Resistance to inhibitors of cholinesterase protein 3 N-terminal domain-containing protein n=1 Tax=Nesidiocoris tenuis TaxID=355587 RepID=A0A6H5HIZ7_9HEMI|nr:unnamed protein product [Nesidiocoris tenuis]